MSDAVFPAYSHTKYAGGENIIFEHEGHAVSVVRTDDGLWDVQADDGSYLYTGHDPAQAQVAVQSYLGK